MTKRTLIFMRHAQAKNQGEENDQARELKDKGKRNAQKVGVWMAQQKLAPDLVIASPAKRVCVTAEKTLKSAGFGVERITQDERLYNSTSMDVFDVITSVADEVKTLMIVGHNPSIEIAMAELANGALPKTKKGGYLPRGALGVFELDCSWSEIGANCARLKELVYPKKLPSDFPFPDAFGAERRIRPSYYYTQSCVVPYRFQKSDLPEVLLITSSKNKHWVLPKGIVEPGLTPQASGALEALEEAGVSGHVHPVSLGQYRYEKWDATCTVDVYAMRVDCMLPPGQWQESHRQRKWSKIDEAEEFLDKPELVGFVKQLPSFLESETL